ncbi:hypothetical protein FOZ61_001124 [Perkinsus olseni]|uniref:Peptidase A1 domain-containing protein n=1 Tax=Perkinsus olseni TaxID=32597 RepID=A0A7J6KQI6_PEROL|nr:hypothetical protein FOZ61_001124 [Perkinsus olseni]
MVQIWKCPLKQPFLSSVEVILSSPISLLKTLLTGALVFIAEPEQISLPLAGGYVSLSLDGQPIEFSLDTGGARSLVLFGPWFEWIHGYGSCQRSFFGCYFCPRDKPCGDIFSRRVWTVLYGGIESYSYVEHSVTLGIGNHEVRDVKFGLIVDYKGGYGQFPMPILGLSLGRANIPETFLEQLKRQQVIDSLSYSIYASALGDGITGILTLEDSVPTSVAYIGFSRKSSCHSDGKISASLSPLGLFDSHGKKLTKRHDSATNEPALVDAGASSLYIPPKDFENIINVTWKTLRRERASFNITKKSDLMCESAWTKMLRRDVVPYLPTLGYTIGDEPRTMSIRIEPKHYIHSCDSHCCRMDIDPDNVGITLLGHPFFRAYDVRFDLTNKRLYFSDNGESS